MATTEERLKFLEDLHERVCKMALEVPLDRRPSRGGYILSLYCSMIELAGGVITLARAQHFTALGPVFRTLMEAFVNLKLVAKDRAFVERFFARHHQDWIKLLGAEGEGNRFLKGIHAHKERKNALKRHKHELTELRKRGVRPMRLADRFQKADMKEEHFSVYHIESDNTHNSWQALISRHWVTDGTKTELVLYRDRSADEIDVYFDSTAGLLLEATDIVHKNLNADKEGDIAALWKQLNRLRDLQP